MSDFTKATRKFWHHYLKAKHKQGQGHHYYEPGCLEFVKNALHYLKRNNNHYQTISNNMQQIEQQLLNLNNSPDEPFEAVKSHSQVHSPKLFTHINFLCSTRKLVL